MRGEKESVDRTGDRRLLYEVNLRLFLEYGCGKEPMAYIPWVSQLRLSIQPQSPSDSRYAGKSTNNSNK